MPPIIPSGQAPHQREITPGTCGQSPPFVAVSLKEMRPVLLPALLVLALSPAQGQDPQEILADEYAREELGVNELTTPSIQRLFTDLDVFKPVPVSLISEGNFDRTYNNRFQTSLNFGSLICDGFFAVVSEQKGLIQKIGRALLKQANSLAVGRRLSRHANSLLELGSRGDWNELKLELIKTQTDVEEAMIELRDEEMAHMVSLGGWLRGFEIGAIVTADNYTAQRAAGLMKPDVIDYFLERLQTLNPRLKNTELVTAITSRLTTIRAITGEAAGRVLTLSEVQRMRDLATEINVAMTAKVDNEGRIVQEQ
jgi:hypothetical protein